MQRDTAKPKRYQNFLTSGKTPTQYPILKEAKAEYAKLQ